MSIAITVNGLCKSYGAHAVLKGVNLSVRSGEIFALLGVNGAGKTTALECIEGLRPYDRGTVHLHGRVGIQLQSSALPAHIRPLEAVRLFAMWNKRRPDPAVLDALGIAELAKKQYASLSTGQKRRLHLALALSADPQILFLDEPAAGLDVEGRQALHGLIRRLKMQGKTIVLASHDMAEVEELCDRIAILDGGKIVFCGTPAELTQKVGRKYRVFVQTNCGAETFETENIGETLLVLLEKYRRSGVQIADIRVGRGTLEEHFLEFAGRKDV